MKTNLPLVIAAVFFFACSVSAQPPTTDLVLENGVAAHKGLDDVYRRFSEGYKKLDPAQVAGLYTDDAFYLSPGADVKRGREKILAEFSGYFDSVQKTGGSLSVAFQILGRQVSGDLAYDVGIYTLTQKNANDESGVGRGKFVVVARQFGNGEWRFQVDGYSDLPNPKNNQSASSDAIVLSNSSTAFSQSNAVKNSASRSRKAIDRKELESFLDKLFAEEMAKYKVPGAVFVLVQDGEVFFAKGYGFADLEKKRRVDPDKTLFRAYSFSKSFTATAVMQLVEQGKLKLDEDVNKYLKRFQIKDKFAEPVTLADLLTHRAGFTDTDVRTQLAQGDYRILDLGEYLKKNLPARSAPPGKFQYSNFGAALAGFIVEEVSGEPFAEYIEKHIFKPLGMSRSTFLLPSQLSQESLADFALSYAIDGGVSRRMRFKEADFSPAPAANLFGGAKILKARRGGMWTKMWWSSLPSTTI